MFSCHSPSSNRLNRPGHLPGLLEDLLDQGSLMIVRDIQIDDALIHVHHANKLLAVRSPQPDPFHGPAPFGYVQHPTSSYRLAAEPPAIEATSDASSGNQSGRVSRTPAANPPRLLKRPFLRLCGRVDRSRALRVPEAQECKHA